ncbi:MAG: histidine--tRNA ligase [Candidatus Altiarchaeota archaeon]
MKIENPKGTRDFTPPEMSQRKRVEDAVKKVLDSFGYEEVSTPIFEYAELFEVKSGSDIKERMYVFDDKGGRKLCLRPELTASVCRMYANELKNSPKPLRLYYSGPMFRYEEPQRGRYREFYQIGVELLGACGAMADAEAVCLACECLETLGLKYRLELGSIKILRGLLGELDISGAKQDKVIALLDEGRRDELKELTDDETLLTLIGLKGGVEEIEKARKLLEGFDEPLKAVEELGEIAGILDGAGVSFTVDFSIARGLEYYTGLVFEVRVEGLGAQNQICGGGRYDNLVELFGGPATPAVGFAFGFDRVCEALKEQGVKTGEVEETVIVAPVGEDACGYALQAAGFLRRELSGSGIKVKTEITGRKLKKVLEYASDSGAGFVVIVGGKEKDENTVTLRDMKAKTQETISVSEAAERLLD